MRHSAEARAGHLAQRALAQGVKTFAILSPDSGYGRSVGAAFAAAVEQGGGSIVTRVTYPRDTKSFASFAKKLTGSWQAVFVPEEADRLGLIAPALAASGRVPRPVGTRKVKGGRPVLLLSTAEGLTGSYIATAGRNSEGALFAPGYYPDDRDPAQKAFLDRFIAAYGRAPGVTEAYAYDAAQLAAAAGRHGRAGLAAALARGALQGLTGTIQFDANHHRADPGVVYTVVDENGAFAIRVAR
jgi:branched-chain amino acid transport system substrate-binding protein